MTYEKIMLTKAQGLATLTLNAPDKLNAVSRRMIAEIKQAIDKAATNTLDQQLDLERDSQRALGQSADCREGVAAFLAKRPAQFTGR